ncbi:hypothetical protein Hanom_Chr16g01418951 [Helianthus anomalus]
MKNPLLLVPSLQGVLLLLLLFPFFFTTTSSTNSPQTSTLHHHHFHDQQSQGLHLRAPPLPRLAKQHPQPALLEEEIDPRYGVPKRLVPTGPNPPQRWYGKPM